MPIDLKWARNHPEQVQEWQKQRGLSTVALESVVQLDEECRQVLAELNRQRTKLKQLQKALRPTLQTKEQQKDEEEAMKKREDVIKEMKTLQVDIRQLDQTWKDLTQKTKESLCRLASPVDTQIVASTHSAKEVQPSSIRSTTSLDFSADRGLDVAHSVLHWARQWFDRYPSLRLSSKEQKVWEDLNLAHSLWGCKEENCEICNNDFACLPSWLSVVERIPPKSMFGAKQLPQYTSIVKYCETTYEILAITPGTTWDSRTIQQELLQEMVGFYETLLVAPCSNASTTPLITIVATPANELHMHERSRMIVLLNNGLILGTVSNFGDAISRTYDIAFATGEKKKKDYVHFVHATVVIPTTLSGILKHNTSLQNNRELVALPQCVWQHLVTEDNDDQQDKDILWISLQSLTPRSFLFAPARQTSTTRRKNRNHAKFSALSNVVPRQYSSRRDKGTQAEALTCPFEFLFASE